MFILIVVVIFVAVRPVNTRLDIPPRPTPEPATVGDFGKEGKRGIRITLAMLASDPVKFLEYDSERLGPIRFFAFKDGAGVGHTALDACVPCYRYGLGYAQRGDDIVCRKCGRAFALRSLEKNPDHCAPIQLNHRLEDGGLMIDVEELERVAGSQAGHPTTRD